MWLKPKALAQVELWSGGIVDLLMAEEPLRFPSLPPAHSFPYAKARDALVLHSCQIFSLLSISPDPGAIEIHNVKILKLLVK